VVYTTDAAANDDDDNDDDDDDDDSIYVTPWDPKTQRRRWRCVVAS